jgi:inner membrane protein
MTEPVRDPIDRFTAALRNSKLLRLLFVGLLALVLQIPIAMISGLVRERQTRRLEAMTEVSSKWGNAQVVSGPALVVPYGLRVIERSSDGQHTSRVETRDAVFLPERLAVDGMVDSAIRSRGIFTIPVFTLDATLEGEFARPSFADLGVEPAFVSWDRARLALGISDARAIQRETTLTWNGREARFLAGDGGFTDAGGSGIHAPVVLDEASDRYRFSFPLALNGSVGAYFTPFGQNTTVELRSDYGHPSFQGNWLPNERVVGADRFEARWSIPSLGRNYPQAWTIGAVNASMRDAIQGSRFGVDLLEPVDHYRMSERSAKYAGLFILLTFATVWLVEVLAGVRVHPIQYLMLGAALCLFYLLELSLSEHLGFPVAYALASVAIVVMAGAFCLVALRRASRASIVGAGVALLYGYLYVLLMNEDYALVIGSIGLFLILATIMFATRRVDWYAAGRSAARPAESV